MAQDEVVIVGKIGSTYGIKGWVKVFSYTEEMASILEFDPWYLEDKNGWTPFKVEGGREHGKVLVVKFKGFENPEDARSLTGKRIAIQQSQLPKLEKDTFYWNELIGLTVINQHGEMIGKVIYLIETGSNDVLVVKSDKEFGIPYLPGKVIKKVDLAKKEIHVDWDII